MLVYRVENKEGIGPFVGSDLGFDCKGFKLPGMVDELRKYDLIPSELSFYEKETYSYWSKFYCATKEKEDLYNWFSDEDWDILTDNGFKIAIYDVPFYEVLELTYQVIFMKEKAVKIN